MFAWLSYVLLDTAAGALLVEEAGGRISDFNGGPFQLDSREVLASNGRIHQELVVLFEAMFAGRDLEPIPTPEEFAQRRAKRSAAAETDKMEKLL